MPGLVEGHSHLFEGALWSKLYCGYFDRQKPDGTTSLGIKNIQELVQKLKHEKKPYWIERTISRMGIRPNLF